MKKTFKYFSIAAMSLAATILFSTATYAQEDIYKVKTGDTLWEISQKYKVDLWNVVDSNPQFEDPDLIYPEQKVIVPLKDATPNTTSGTTTNSATRGTTSTQKSASKGNMPSLSANKPSNQSYEKQVLDLCNKERKAKGLKALTLSTNVSSAARYKSQDMMNKGYFSHTSPTYGDPFTMLRNFGIKYTSAGENIAKGQKTPQAVVGAWMNSAGHRKNIMNPNFTQLGVGYAKSSNGTTYWTQIFLRP